MTQHNTEWPARGCELYGHEYHGKSPCVICGSRYVELTEVEKRIAATVLYELFDEAGREQHAEQVARKISRALGLAETFPVRGVDRSTQRLNARIHTFPM